MLTDPPQYGILCIEVESIPDLNQVVDYPIQSKEKNMDKLKTFQNILDSGKVEVYTEEYILIEREIRKIKAQHEERAEKVAKRNTMFGNAVLDILKSKPFRYPMTAVDVQWNDTTFFAGRTTQFVSCTLRRLCKEGRVERVPKEEAVRLGNSMVQYVAVIG